MVRIVASLVAGVLFGIGLSVSEMVDPAKVIAFLDLAGNWDPSLAFVMGGAVLVSAIGYRFVLRRPGPLFGGRFELPTLTRIDQRLLTGAAVFGVGWGLAGFCPGPAVASLAFGIPESVVFVVAMLTGMALESQLGRPRRVEARVERLPGSLATDG